MRREERDIFLEKRNKTVKAVGVWICENCHEEFLDDASREKLYQPARVARKRRVLAA
ncbi:YgiT-type zinc finger protein [candidate division KSB1 bacterium]|nr:YgiT-type zinc finger protein [candidate division KSB1 bacterium]